MKAQTLPQVIRAFDPMHPLSGQELKEWYIDRPHNPLELMKIYLQVGIGKQTGQDSVYGTRWQR